MDKITNINDQRQNEGKYQVEYHIDNETKRVISIGHPDWPFTIQRKDNEIAFVSDDGEPFGILERDVFNTILSCWLLVDDPKLVDER